MLFILVVMTENMAVDWGVPVILLTVREDHRGHGEPTNLEYVTQNMPIRFAEYSESPYSITCCFERHRKENVRKSPARVAE